MPLFLNQLCAGSACRSSPLTISLTLIMTCKILPAAVPVSGAAAHSQGLRRSGAPKRAFSDIDSLSSEKDLHRKKGRRTKHSAKRASPDVLKERQTSEKNIRATLGKKCSCKRKCLAQFTDIQSFGALVDFRKTFCWHAQA